MFPQTHNNSEAFMCSTGWTSASFEFTRLREMYTQRNSSGAFVLLNQHGPKTYLYNCNVLKLCHIFFGGRKYSLKAFV